MTDKTFPCSLCSKVFETSQGLGSHKFKQHNIRGAGRKPAPKLSTGKIVCALCEHEPEFDSKKCLGQHYRYEHGGAKKARTKVNDNGATKAVVHPPAKSGGVSLEEAIATLEAEVMATQQTILRLKELSRI